MKNITIFFPYYNQQEALEFQLSYYSTFPEEIRKNIQIFIVDDGSQNHKACDYITNEHLDNLSITLHRIDIDIPWNQVETNNLAFKNIETDFILRVDIDIFIDQDNLLKLILNDSNLACRMKYKSYYTNDFLSKDGHPNVFLLPKNIYKNYRYNEYFSGNYGYEDNDFRHKLSKDKKLVFLEDRFVFVRNQEFSTKNLNRDTSINKSKKDDPNRPFFCFLHKDYYKLQILNSKKIKIIGLMLTRDDNIILEDWLNKYSIEFDNIFALDGSKLYKNESMSILEKYNVKYFHDNDFIFSTKNDQTLRNVLFEKIKEYINDTNNIQYNDNWIVCVHPDEFYIEKLNHVIQKAYKNNSEVIIYHALHNMPHTSEKNIIIESKDYKLLSYFMHNYKNSYKENRIFKFNINQYYDQNNKGVFPLNINFNNSKLFYPNYFHYKILYFDISYYNQKGTILKSLWSGLSSHFPTEHTFLSIDDLFINEPSGKYKNYVLYNKNEELPKELLFEL